MPPLWLLLDLHDMAAVTAGLFFTGSLVVTVFAAEFVNHHSTVERSTSTGTPAPAGVDRWAAGASGQGSTPCAGHVPAVQTEQRYRPACVTPERVTVGGPPTQT
jgi:hypothetical protein